MIISVFDFQRIVIELVAHMVVEGRLAAVSVFESGLWGALRIENVAVLTIRL